MIVFYVCTYIHMHAKRTCMSMQLHTSHSCYFINIVTVDIYLLCFYVRIDVFLFILDVCASKIAQQLLACPSECSWRLTFYVFYDRSAT